MLAQTISLMNPNLSLNKEEDKVVISVKLYTFREETYYSMVSAAISFNKVEDAPQFLEESASYT